MELKNITPFDKFKRIVEATIPSEFQNKTGFAESLVGRALFSIIRYFKQGVDMGRLHYMKNKLENEYFAGVLRLCAMKGIDLKEPKYTSAEDATLQDDTHDDGGGGVVDDGGGQNVQVEESPIICSIMFMDYTKKNDLEGQKNNFEAWKKNLEESRDDYQDNPTELAEIDTAIQQLELYLQCIQIKMSINQEFEVLYPYHQTQDANFDEEATRIILLSLDKILVFLKDDKLKQCSRYKLTPTAEQIIIDKLSTCSPDSIKNKCKEINILIGKAQAQPQPAPVATGNPVTTQGTEGNESTHYEDSDMLFEKIGSGIRINQILGDVLNTAGATGQTSTKVDTKTYLAKIGISTVDQIDFKKLAEIFQKHPTLRDEAAELVSLPGIRDIQYVVARIIYRIKKTPTYTGITPATGGGVSYDEDSALRTYWERLVEKVKGEWIYFINLEDYKLDPFKAQTLQDAIRKSSSSGEILNKTVTRASDALVDSANASKAGLVPYQGDYRQENTPVVLQVRQGDELAYILCSLHFSHVKPESKVFRYLGNINLHKIIQEKLYENASFKTNAKQYATSIYDSDHDTKACSPFLKRVTKMNFGYQNKQGVTGEYYLNGVYFGSLDFQKFSTQGQPRTQNTHWLSFYLKSTVLTIVSNFTAYRTKPGPNDILMMADGKPIDITDLRSSPYVNWAVGQLFTFEDSTWAQAYFPNFSTAITAGVGVPVPITAADYSTIIIFKK